ncbi:PEP-CTERM sorting domain-containing protein [Leptolyngbya sp. 15MV]|nr:PEP-CTERM sorting domain-containing protein [Leptolyngbya sp. 15MV]
MLAAAGSASAGIVFSNVSVTGSLSTGATFTTTATDIDFSFPNAIVGDVAPTRQGNIVITYEARSAAGSGPVNLNVLSILGALSGSGQIFFNEVIEDIITGNILATFNVALSSNAQLPYTAPISFPDNSAIKVKKTLTLVAPDTAGLDLAAVNLIEQKLVPTPGTLALAGVAGMALAYRRRR